MLVLLPLLANSLIRQGVLATLATRGVIVAGPELEVRWEIEHFTNRHEEIVGVAAGEITTGRTHVGIEERITAEDVF